MEKTFKVGDPCIGINSAYYQQGEIKESEISTGARKERIYRVGINWFFADELRPWYDGMIAKLIGKDIQYRPKREICFTHDRIKYVVQAIVFNEYINHCYLIVDKTEGTYPVNEEYSGIGFYDLRQRQKERIYAELLADLSGC